MTYEMVIAMGLFWIWLVWEGLSKELTFELFPKWPEGSSCTKLRRAFQAVDMVGTKTLLVFLVNPMGRRRWINLELSEWEWELSVLVSCGCCNKLSNLGGLKQTDIYSLIIQEARVSKSGSLAKIKVLQVCTLFLGSREQSVPCFFQLLVPTSTY